MARVRQRRQAGFTLLELLVSLLLLGLIMMLGQGGVRLGARTWEAVGTRAEQTSQTQMIRAFLLRELAQATPVLALRPDGSRGLAYEGTEDSLIFIAPLAPHFGLGGLQRIRLAIVEDPDATDRAKRLILRRRPYYGDDDFAVDSDLDEEHILLDGIAEASFAYRRDAADGIGGWSSAWRGEEALPLMIRVQLVFGARQAAEWPDLLALRRITADPGCLIPIGAPNCHGS